MTYTITLSREKIFSKILLLSSYQAAKDDVTTYDRCRVKTSDREIIDTYYDEFLVEFTPLVTKYLHDTGCPCCSHENDDATFTLDIPDFPRHLLKTLDLLATQLCAYYCLTRWYAMLISKQTPGSADASVVAQNQYATDTENFRHILNTRVHPVRLKSSVI